MGGSKRGEGFDGAAAVTRSLLGYGMLAGAFYLVVGVAPALTREGFSFAGLGYFGRKEADPALMELQDR